jgi:ATP-dependent protease HslVU (ClpYQ) peptidase subunit
MAADRRTTFTGGLLGPYQVSKVHKGQGILVAAAGDHLLIDRISEVLPKAKTTNKALESIRAIFRAPNSGGHALVLTADRLIEVTSGGALVDLAKEQLFWAIGSGYQVALGYLAAKHATGRVDGDTAKQAILYASTLVADVGDGFQLETLR